VWLAVLNIWAGPKQDRIRAGQTKRDLAQFTGPTINLPGRNDSAAARLVMQLDAVHDGRKVRRVGVDE
jgi:hypothetical protein